MDDSKITTTEEGLREEDPDYSMYIFKYHFTENGVTLIFNNTLKNWLNYLYYICGPVILLVGTCGNVLSTVVMKSNTTR